MRSFSATANSHGEIFRASCCLWKYNLEIAYKFNIKLDKHQHIVWHLYKHSPETSLQITMNIRDPTIFWSITYMTFLPMNRSFLGGD